MSFFLIPCAFTAGICFLFTMLGFTLATIRPYLDKRFNVVQKLAPVAQQKTEKPVVMTMTEEQFNAVQAKKTEKSGVV